MAENIKPPKKSLTPDWLVQGVLTKIGDTFDRLLGRGWKPSSSLATSELIERLKSLLDAEARENGDHSKFVPHNITLKMQWDKFSTDSDESLRKLEAELLTATIDHINDKRYYTQGPVSLEVKPDYFTKGVKLYVSFDKNDADEREAQIDVHASEPPVEPAERSANMSEHTAVATFAVNGTPVVRKLSLSEGERLSIGRTKENDLAIDDISVSKFHASLAVAEGGSLIIADTGSTNGTFVNGERIPYGKARAIGTADKLKLGSVEVKLELLPAPARPMALPGSQMPTEAYKVGDFEFTSRTEQSLPQESVKEELEGKNEASRPDSKDQAIEQTD